jgi:3-oxoacyl-[acyl-carrier-protein] synthase III
MTRELGYVMSGVSSTIGQRVPIDEFARRYPIPNRRNPDVTLTGEEIRRIVGVEGKAWEPDRFREFDTLVNVAREGLSAAQLAPEQVDLMLVVTCTPRHVMMDLDAFELARALGIPDHISPIQLNAGCAGMARAMTIVAQTNAKHVLIVSYLLASQYFEADIYRYNTGHPAADLLWLTPVLFSDGAAAVVLRRDPKARGFVTYSRDAQSFGDQPGFHDSLADFLGGGAVHPPGTPGSEQLACFSVHGPQTRAYYAKGVQLNHDALEHQRPGYGKEVRRIYLHQANPLLVAAAIEQFATESGLDRELFPSNARQYGNLVGPSTVALLHNDITEGVVRSGDEVCVSVVGAGPERGAYLIAVG